MCGWRSSPTLSGLRPCRVLASVAALLNTPLQFHSESTFAVQLLPSQLPWWLFFAFWMRCWASMKPLRAKPSEKKNMIFGLSATTATAVHLFSNKSCIDGGNERGGRVNSTFLFDDLGTGYSTRRYFGHSLSNPVTRTPQLPWTVRNRCATEQRPHSLYRWSRWSNDRCTAILGRQPESFLLLTPTGELTMFPPRAAPGCRSRNVPSALPDSRGSQKSTAVPISPEFQSTSAVPVDPWQSA
jgi:hypothetical protein